MGLRPLLITLLFLIMNNITNKELNALYTAIFMLEEEAKRLEKSMPSDENEADISTFMLHNDLKESAKGLKDLGKVLRSIRFPPKIVTGKLYICAC